MINKGKILLVSLDFPPLGGGQGVYVENLAQELSKNDYVVTVLTTKLNRKKEYKFKIKEIGYKGQNPIMFIILSYLYYIFNLKKENYNIIHGNSINHLLFLLFKNKATEYITTIHNTYLQRMESKKESLLYNLIYPIFIKLERLVLNRSDKIVAVSRSTKNYINKITNNKNIFIIENGVDTDRYKPDQKENNVFRFLYVGRLEMRKSVLETVKIFKEFIIQYEGDKRIEFIIVGNGPEYKKIDKYINKNNLNQIKLVGYSSNVKQYYDKANCLLLLSRGEGLPLAILEAMGCGLSVIVTKDASGLSNVVRDSINGYIVMDQLDKEEIVNKMKSVISNHEVFSKKSELIAKNYDWSIIVNKYLKIYNT